MTEEILKLREELEREKEKYRRYEAYMVSDFKLLLDFSKKYNFTFYSVEIFLEKIENLLNHDEAVRHSINTVREYSDKLKNVTDFLEKEREIIFADFEMMQKVKSFKVEKQAIARDYYNLKTEN